MGKAMRLTTRHIIRSMLIALLANAFVGCGAESRAVGLATRATGMSVLEVIKEFGAPSVDRRVVATTQVLDLCARNPDYVRVLEYHEPANGFVRSALKTVGLQSLSAMTLLCVDKANIVRAVNQIEF